MKRATVVGIFLLWISCWGAALGKTPADFQREALDLMKVKKWQQAHQVLQKCIDQFDQRAKALYGPKFGWFWYHKGFCEMKLERWDDAISVLELNIDLFPDFPSAYDAMGEAYTCSGQESEAIACYERSLSIDPNNAFAERKLRQLKEANDKEP